MLELLIETIIESNGVCKIKNIKLMTPQIKTSIELTIIVHDVKTRPFEPTDAPNLSKTK